MTRRKGAGKNETWDDSDKKESQFQDSCLTRVSHVSQIMTYQAPFSPEADYHYH